MQFKAVGFGFCGVEGLPRALKVHFFGIDMRKSYTGALTGRFFGVQVELKVSSLLQVSSEACELRPLRKVNH